MNKKARKKALRGVLSMRAADGKVIILDAFPVADGKTKTVARALSAIGTAQPKSSVLIVDSADNGDLVRGSRNLPRSRWLAPEGLNVYDVLRHETLLLTKASVDKIGEVLRP